MTTDAVLPFIRHLHKLLKWSEPIVSIATDYIQTKMRHRPYIGIHLRIGSDWVSYTLRLLMYPEVINFSAFSSVHVIMQ